MLYNTVMSINHRMIMGEEMPCNERRVVVEKILFSCRQHQQEIEYLKDRSDHMYPHYLVPTNVEKSIERSKNLVL